MRKVMGRGIPRPIFSLILINGDKFQTKLKLGTAFYIDYFIFTIDDFSKAFGGAQQLIIFSRRWGRAKPIFDFQFSICDLFLCALCALGGCLL